MKDYKAIAKNASSEFINSIRDTPAAYYGNPTDALAILLGEHTTAKLIDFLAIKYPARNWRLNEIYLDCKEEPQTFAQVIGTRKTAVLLAALQCSRYLVEEKVTTVKSVVSADQTVDYVYDRFALRLRDVKKKYFFVLLLDARNQILQDIEISQGTIQDVLVDPADILREACIHHARRVILVDNRPDGQTDPSQEDINLTDQIVHALQYVGIKVADHIIIGDCPATTYSFVRSGRLF